MTTEKIELIIQQLILYCIRSPDANESIYFAINRQVTTEYTFNDLLIKNVTSSELLSWMGTIDIVESYEEFIQTKSASLGNVKYYNCTPPWFGSRCLYSFNIAADFNTLIRNKLAKISSVQNSVSKPPQFTCYTQLECDRANSSNCLDWREICDGKIDCANENIDEHLCYQLEANECAEDEYRCRNGLCIPASFVNDDVSSPDCLDRTDEPVIQTSLSDCFADITFRYEEHTCQYPKERLCDYGNCAHQFENCESAREKLRFRSILEYYSNLHLTYEYWLAVTCLTNAEAIRSLQQNCPARFFFLQHYVVQNHIHLLFSTNDSNIVHVNILLPSSICFKS